MANKTKDTYRANIEIDNNGKAVIIPNKHGRYIISYCLKARG
jgi:hypothetical protein